MSWSCSTGTLNRGLATESSSFPHGTGHRSHFPRLNTLILGQIATAIRRRADDRLKQRRMMFDLPYTKVLDMRLNEFRMTLRGIACLAAVAGLLAGCGGSASTAGGSLPSGSGGVSTPPPITGVSTPSSVSVVTAN
jgi:hypothetical protein